MSTRYRTIVADPPWDHSDGTGARITVGMSQRAHPNTGVTSLPYPTMTVEEIKALPVRDLVDNDRLVEPGAHLYLWATNRYVRHVWDVAEAWGFTGVCLLVWCKESRGWLPGGAYPSNVEFCLFARCGKLKSHGGARSRWFNWPRTFGSSVREGERRQSGHSAKPEAFLDLVEQVSPGPYLELFARRQRLGWDTWGNEALEHVTLEMTR